MFYSIKGEGVPILMIHGFGIDHTVMEEIFESINHKDSFKRVYIDLPHMGLSQNIRCEGSDDYVDLLEEFCNEHMKEEFIIAGFSYGGYLARALENRIKRVKGTILICPVVKTKREDRILPEFEVFVQDDYVKTKSNEDYEEMYVIQNKRTYDLNEKCFAKAFELANGEKLSQIFRNSYELSKNPDEVKTDNPCLLLIGKQDVTVGYKDALSIIDRYKYITVGLLNQAGHGLPIEQPELTKEHIDNYLKGMIL